MAGKRHKPPPDLVEKAADALRRPEKASMRTVKRMAAEVLDNQQYNPKKSTAPKPNRSTRPKKG